MECAPEVVPWNFLELPVFHYIIDVLQRLQEFTLFDKTIPAAIQTSIKVIAWVKLYLRRSPESIVPKWRQYLKDAFALSRRLWKETMRSLRV